MSAYHNSYNYQQDSSQDGWTLYYNEDGYPYYYNSITGESQWADTESYSHQDTAAYNTHTSHRAHHSSSNYFAYETQPNVTEGYIQDDIYAAPSYSDISDESSDSDLEERFQAYLQSQEGKHELADEYNRLEKHAAKAAKRQSDEYVRQHKKHDDKSSVRDRISFWEGKKSTKRVTFEAPAVQEESDIEENTDSTEVSSEDSDVKLMNMPVYPEWLSLQSILSNTQHVVTHPISTIEPYTSYLWNNVLTSQSTDRSLNTWIYNSFIATTEVLWGYFNQVAKYVVDGADAATPLEVESVRVDEIAVEDVDDDIT